MERTAKIAHIPRVLYHWRKLPRVDSQRRPGQAVGARRRPRLRSRTTCGATGVDAEVLPGRTAGALPHPPPDPRAAAGVDRHPDCRAAADGERPAGGHARKRRSAASSRRPATIAYELVVVADAEGVQPGTQRALDGTAHRIVRFERLGLFNFSAKVNAGAAVAAGDAPAAVQRRPRGHVARLAGRDARILAGAGSRRGRSQAPLSGRPAAAHRHGAGRGRGRRARLSPASGRVARLRGQRRHGRATTRPSPARA